MPIGWSTHPCADNHLWALSKHAFPCACTCGSHLHKRFHSSCTCFRASNDQASHRVSASTSLLYLRAVGNSLVHQRRHLLGEARHAHGAAVHRLLPQRGALPQLPGGFGHGGQECLVDRGLHQEALRAGAVLATALERAAQRGRHRLIRQRAQWQLSTACQYLVFACGVGRMHSGTSRVI